MLISLSSVTATESRWLEEAVHRTFGEFNREFLDAMKPELHWVRLTAGSMLFEQGAREDALYFVVAGRLRAIVRDEHGDERAVGDIRRGETVGEMALLTGEPRSARIIAIRDSLLVRLSRQSYEKVIRVYPLVSLHVSRFIVERLRRADDPRLSWARSGTIAVLPLSKSARCIELTQQLLPLMAGHGRVECLDEQRLAGEMGVNEAAGNGPVAADRWQQVSRWVDDREAASDVVLLASENPDSQWALQCAAHADEILWIANAGDDDLHATAESGLITARSGTLARQTLLLVHPAGTHVPRHTGRWLERFPTDRHLHLRRDNGGDLARLARTMMGRSTGLVFGGGGARGFAHLGVLKALEEARIPVDALGGCSIGATMASCAAFDRPAGEVIDMARRFFSKNPTGDINPFPVISLIKGRRLRHTIDGAVRELAGFDADIEDTWKPLYCVASNYSAAEEAILERGSLARAVRASVSIPAALPPVLIDGHLMVDGGTFNNFPTDIMARKGANLILGCDLMRDNTRRVDLEDMPSSAALAMDRLRPRRRRRYRLPSLASIMLNVSILHSQSKLAASRAHADVCFTPDVGRIGMLDWKAFDRAVEAGYRHAQQTLDDLPEAVRADIGKVQGS